MPQSCLLVCAVAVDIVDVQRHLESLWTARLFAEPTEIQLQPEDGSWYVSIVKANNPQDLLDEYKRNGDLPAGLREAHDPTVLSVYFNAYEVVRLVVAHILTVFGAASEWWLDNDYGAIIPALEVLERIRIDPEWDWRVTGG